MPEIADFILPNLVIVLAAALQAATGVGFGMIAVPLLALIDLSWVPAPVLMLNVILSLAMATADRSALVRAEVPPIMGGLVLGTILGTGILMAIPAERLGVLIGVVICAAVAAAVAAPSVRLTRPRILGAATAGGVTGLIAAMHGPPLVLLYSRERPAKVRATMGTVFMAGCLMALVALTFSGLFGRAQFVAGLVLLPGLALGYGAGRWMAGRLSPAMARAAMLAVSGAAGLMLIIKSL